MPRNATHIECTFEEARQLQRFISGRVVPKHLAQRAQIILDCVAGKTNRNIAYEQNICEQTVAK